MNPRDVHPIAFFNEWFAEPFDVQDYSVAGIVDALNRHPIAGDPTAQDYVMPMRRCREHAGRFRVYGENQDVYYCFVYEGDESKTDPPVYFESCLDLHTDYGIDQSDIIDGDHVLVAERFASFLWQVLGHHICLRMESGGHFSSHVTGVVFNGGVDLDASFINQLGSDFPAGYTCFVSDSAICIPDWGAAFLTARSRESFMTRYSPNVSREWA
jgi:hypothetical protein